MPTKKKNYNKNFNSFPLKQKQYSVQKVVTVDFVLQSSTIGVPGTLIFRANDCGDPFEGATAASYQPRGYDQLAGLYNKSVVVGSRMKIAWQPSNAGINIMGIAILNTPVPRTTIRDYLESKHVVYTMGGGNSAHDTMHLTSKFSTKKFAQIDDVLDNDDLYGITSTIQANTVQPLTEWYFHIFTIDMDDDGSQGVQEPLIDLNYSIVFMDPKEIVAS